MSRSSRISIGPVVVLFLLMCRCGGASADGDATDKAPDVLEDPGLHDPGPEAPDDMGGLPELVDDAGIPDVPADGPAETGDAADEDVVSDDSGTTQPWRSLLYPAGWTPGFQDSEGRYLHDFSYAGYRNGEAPVQLGGGYPLMVADVTDHGADGTGAADSTAAIQAAIDEVAVAGGGSVFFPEGLYRVDGQLVVTSSHTVLRGEGPVKSRLHFTSHEGMAQKAHLQFRGILTSDVETILIQDGSTMETVLAVGDATGFGVCDDVQVGWVVTPEFIEEHGMTGTWKAFNDSWQVFFHRNVKAVDAISTPNTITMDVPLRYPARIANQASIRRITGMIEECGFESLGIASAVGWEEAWAQNHARVIEFNGVSDGWITGVHSFPSPSAPDDGPVPNAHLQSGGILLESCKRVTIADCHLGFAQNRGGGGNGYLYEYRMSSEILTQDCVGDAGRHNFVQNWGFGFTGGVWLRVTSRDGIAVATKDFPYGSAGYSEFHHSLATANLVDSCVMDDGWSAVNRGDWSSGAGHSATQNVLWNTTGTGHLTSYQFGWGYVVGTGPENTVQTWLPNSLGTGTEPEDWVEGEGQATTLEPQSLYEDQLARRLGL